MFNFSSSFSVTSIPDLTNRVALVTGANTGIGHEISLQLALHGAKVYLACRSSSKASLAIQRIKHLSPGAKVEFVPLNLACLQDVRDTISTLQSKESGVDIVICNAGVIEREYKLTEDGIEMDFQVNYLGHFLLVRGLLDMMLTSKDPRIVVLASEAHRKYSAKDMLFSSLENINAQRSYLQRYGQSKLAVVLFARELATRVSDRGIFVNSVNPGDVATGLTSTIALPPVIANLYLIRGLFEKRPGCLLWTYDLLSPLVLKSPAQGSLTALFAATGHEIVDRRITGEYIVPPSKTGRVSPLGRDIQRQNALWELSEELLQQRGFPLSPLI